MVTLAKAIGNRTAATRARTVRAGRGDETRVFSSYSDSISSLYAARWRLSGNCSGGARGIGWRGDIHGWHIDDQPRGRPKCGSWLQSRFRVFDGGVQSSGASAASSAALYTGALDTDVANGSVQSPSFLGPAVMPVVVAQFGQAANR